MDTTTEIDLLICKPDTHINRDGHHYTGIDIHVSKWIVLTIVDILKDEFIFIKRHIVLVLFVPRCT